MYERFISSSMLTGMRFGVGVFMNSMKRTNGGSVRLGLRLTAVGRSSSAQQRADYSTARLCRVLRGPEFPEAPAALSGLRVRVPTNTSEFMVRRRDSARRERCLQ